MNRLKNSFFYLFLVSVIGSLQADFIQLSVWQRKTDAGVSQQLVICSDNHGKKAVGLQQAQELTAFMHGRNNGSILIEDTFDYQKSLDWLSNVDDEQCSALVNELQDFQINRLDPYRRKAVTDNVFSGILLVSKLARELGIACENVEFRHFITGLINDTLTIIDEHGYDRCVIAKQLIDKVYAEILTFNDTPALNEYYQEAVQKLAQIKNLYEQFMLTNKPASQIFDFVCDMVMDDPTSFDLTCLTYTCDYPYLISQKQKTCTLYEQLLTNKRSVHRDTVRRQIESDLMDRAFSIFIDVYVLHALYVKQVTHSAANTVALCVGLAHSLCVEKFLPQLGYACIAIHKDADGVSVADVLQDIPENAPEAKAYVLTDTVYAIVDGVKSVIKTVGTFLRLV
jgi:hypothetical protein